MNFKKFKKVIINNGERDYIFYTGDSFNDYDSLTILVDEKDNIIDVYCGIYPKLYKNILFIAPTIQGGVYLDINTGEQLFKDFTSSSKYRCFESFKYGYAKMYNGKKNKYDVFDINGNILKSYKSFNMLNENVGIIEDGQLFNNRTFIDRDFNIISKNCFNSILNKNDKYIIAKGGKSENDSLYYLFNYNGDKISEGYTVLNTKDFNSFKTRKKGQGRDYAQLNLDEVLMNL